MSNIIIPENCPSVCFTGHRTVTDAEHKLIIKHLDGMIRLLIEKHNTRNFYAGGALGFDTFGAIAVITLRAYFPEIRLHLVLPCRDQHIRWNEKDQSLYRHIIDRADSHIFLSDHYYRGCMHVRNRKMVDSSDLCIAYLRPLSDHGGTAYTVRYAQQKNLPVINIADSDWRVTK